MSLKRKLRATLDDFVWKWLQANELKQLMITSYEGMIFIVLSGDSAEEFILRYEEDLRQIKEETEFVRIEGERKREEDAELVKF